MKKVKTTCNKIYSIGKLESQCEPVIRFFNHEKTHCIKVFIDVKLSERNELYDKFKAIQMSDWGAVIECPQELIEKELTGYISPIGGKPVKNLMKQNSIKNILYIMRVLTDVFIEAERCGIYFNQFHMDKVYYDESGKFKYLGPEDVYIRGKDSFRKIYDGYIVPDKIRENRGLPDEHSNAMILVGCLKQLYESSQLVNLPEGFKENDPLSVVDDFVEIMKANKAEEDFSIRETIRPDEVKRLLNVLIRLVSKCPRCGEFMIGRMDDLQCLCMLCDHTFSAHTHLEMGHQVKCGDQWERIRQGRLFLNANVTTIYMHELAGRMSGDDLDKAFSVYLDPKQGMVLLQNDEGIRLRVLRNNNCLSVKNQIRLKKNDYIICEYSEKHEEIDIFTVFQLR